MKFSWLLYILIFFATISRAQPVWQNSLDGEIRFYQTTDFGIVLAGTDKSLYALDGQTGERTWRKSHKGLDETSIVPVPSTDLILVSIDLGEKSRVEAVDLLSGETLWRSEKMKGDVMQVAVEPEQDLLVAVLVKKAKGEIGRELKRQPVLHVLRLSDGDELWKKQLGSDVEMMPSRFGENLGEVPFTLDNYRPPLILDGKIYVFYEGITVYEAQNGRETERERFKVNESGLALTEADVVFNEKFIYISGRGKVRAVNRQNSKVEWEAKDLGIAAEIAVVGNVLYVRTGGQFTRIKDGETEEKGPFGISAIDTRNGKTLWRYKGADKGITNFVFADANTILIADRDDLILLDARNGKPVFKTNHKIEKAQFVLINENGAAVIGGREEIAAFEIKSSHPRMSKGAEDSQNASFIKEVQQKSEIRNRELWRVKHKPPSRGLFRIVAGIALRAAAIYFRYGGLATSALNIVRSASLARSFMSLRWSGLKVRFGSFDLTTLAANSVQNYVSNRITVFGVASRTPNILNRINGLQIITPSQIRSSIFSGTMRRITPSRESLQESFLDRLDPIRRAEKLSDYLLKRKRLADLRGNFMYFYTDLPKPFDRKGLIGVNIHTGHDARLVLASTPDARFTIDETIGLLYSADGNRLQAFEVLNK